MDSVQQNLNAISICQAEQGKNYAEIFRSLQNKTMCPDHAESRMKILDNNRKVLQKHLNLASQKLKDFRRIVVYKENLKEMKFRMIYYHFLAIYFYVWFYFLGAPLDYFRLTYAVLNILFTALALVGLQKWQRNKLLWFIVGQIICIILNLGLAVLVFYYGEGYYYLTGINAIGFSFRKISTIRQWIRQYQDMKQPKPNTREIEAVAAWLSKFNM